MDKNQINGDNYNKKTKTTIQNKRIQSRHNYDSYDMDINRNQHIYVRL